LNESIRNSKTEILLKIKPKLAEFFATNNMDFLSKDVSQVIKDTKEGGLATLKKLTNQPNNQNSV